MDEALKRIEAAIRRVANLGSQAAADEAFEVVKAEVLALVEAQEDA